MATIMHYDGAIVTQWQHAGTNGKRAKVWRFTLKYGDECPDLILAQASSASPPKPPAICPWCGDKFLRRQEVERHCLSAHLPSWLFCPHPSCPWRGSRKEELKKHVDKKLCATSTETKPEDFMIYDPKWIFDFIFDKSIDTPIISRLRVGEEYAIGFVGERMMELQKTETWVASDGLWGRRLKGT
jgi:hypothetical protein